MLSRNLMKVICLLIISGISLGGCVTTDTASVTCKTISFVYLSHKDTKETQRQVAGNNGALVSLGCPIPPKKQ